MLEITKTCPVCRGLLRYESYFGKYICSTVKCKYTEEVPKKDLNKTINTLLLGIKLLRKAIDKDRSETDEELKSELEKYEITLNKTINDWENDQ
jgi:hypothetical protein